MDSIRQDILDKHKKSRVISEAFLFQLNPAEIDYIAMLGLSPKEREKFKNVRKKLKQSQK